MSWTTTGEKMVKRGGGAVAAGYVCLMVGLVSSGCGVVDEVQDGGLDPASFAATGGSGGQSQSQGSGGAATSGVGGAPTPIVSGAAGDRAGAGGAPAGIASAISGGAAGASGAAGAGAGDQGSGDHGGSGGRPAPALGAGGSAPPPGGSGGSPAPAAGGTSGGPDTGASGAPAPGAGGSAPPPGGSGGSAPPRVDTLYFSEYVEGSSYNKAVEIRNPWIAPLDLASCAIKIYFNGATSPNATIALEGTVAAGDVFVVCHTSAADPIRAACDLANGNLNFNGNDAVALVCVGAAVDVIGQIGIDPGEAWGTAPISTVNATLRRRCGVSQGDANASNAFAPELEWAGAPIDTFDDLGVPSCAE